VSVEKPSPKVKTSVLAQRGNGASSFEPHGYIVYSFDRVGTDKTEVPIDHIGIGRAHSRMTAT
jgi:hypothetical protein